MKINEDASLPVTLVVFAYNQESYIEAAVNSVLSQDYSNLKIVISDDCSSDRTFERAKQMIDTYSGSHIIELRRNDKNLGLINHVNTVISEVDTELVVLAAGDDISLPHRVSKLVNVYKSSGKPKLLFSTAFRIDAAGRLLEGFAPDPVIPIEDLNGVINSLSHIDEKIGLYLGASGAWSMDLWRKYGPIQYANCWEDVVMGFRAALEGSFKFIDEPLLMYRVNIGLSSQTGQSLSKKLVMRKQKINLKLDLAKQRYLDMAMSPKSQFEACSQTISLQALNYSVRMAFYQSPKSILIHFRKYPILTLKQGFSEAKFLMRAVIGSSLRITQNILCNRNWHGKYK